MPVSTATHDVQFEVFNDTAWPVTVRILRGSGSSSRLGPPASVDPGESLALVVATGTLYRYVIERDLNARIRAVEMSVNIWRDADCHVSQIFEAPFSPYRCGCNWHIPLGDGIKVALRVWGQSSQATRLPAMTQDPCHDTGWEGGGGGNR